MPDLTAESSDDECAFFASHDSSDDESIDDAFANVSGTCRTVTISEEDTHNMHTATSNTYSPRSSFDDVVSDSVTTEDDERYEHSVTLPPTSGGKAV